MFFIIRMILNAVHSVLQFSNHHIINPSTGVPPLGHCSLKLVLMHNVNTTFLVQSVSLLFITSNVFKLSTFVN